MSTKNPPKTPAPAPSNAAKPETPAAPAAPGAALAPRTDPAPNPLRNPPAPSLPKRPPGRPRKSDAVAPSPAGAAPSTTPTPAIVEAPRWREWPADPAAQKAAIESVAGEVGMGLAILDALATCMPPQRPLSEQERAAIAEPLGRVAWKYGANIPPEVALISALAFVGMGRWIEVKASKGDPVIVGGKLAGKADAANGEARAAA